MEGYTIEMGELQQSILKHIFECKSKSENANHIAKSLGLAQPTVFKSIQLLLKENYLESQQSTKHTEKKLTLTDKGAAAAVLLGVTFDQFENHYKRQRHPDIRNLQFIKSMFKMPEKRDFMIKKGMEYAFKNNYFGEGSTIKQLSQEELKNLRIYMAMEYIKSLPPTTNIRSIKEFIDRYQLDKEIMKEYLNKQKQFAEVLLKELDK
jgi:DNA-binding MarR family transcriptional regulator